MATIKEYKGSIGLSGGLTPKGGQTHALMEAHDILVDRQEGVDTRLDKKLENLTNAQNSFQKSNYDIASYDKAGMVRVGSGLQIDEEGILSVKTDENAVQPTTAYSGENRSSSSTSEYHQIVLRPKDYNGYYGTIHSEMSELRRGIVFTNVNAANPEKQPVKEEYVLPYQDRGKDGTYEILTTYLDVVGATQGYDLSKGTIEERLNIIESTFAQQDDVLTNSQDVVYSYQHVLGRPGYYSLNLYTMLYETSAIGAPVGTPTYIGGGIMYWSKGTETRYAFYTEKTPTNNTATSPSQLSPLYITIDNKGIVSCVRLNVDQAPAGNTTTYIMIKPLGYHNSFKNAVLGQKPHTITLEAKEIKENVIIDIPNDRYPVWWEVRMNRSTDNLIHIKDIEYSDHRGLYYVDMLDGSKDTFNGDNQFRLKLENADDYKSTANIVIKYGYYPRQTFVEEIPHGDFELSNKTTINGVTEYTINTLSWGIPEKYRGKIVAKYYSINKIKDSALTDFQVTDIEQDPDSADHLLIRYICKSKSSWDRFILSIIYQNRS